MDAEKNEGRFNYGQSGTRAENAAISARARAEVNPDGKPLGSGKLSEKTKQSISPELRALIEQEAFNQDPSLAGSSYLTSQGDPGAFVAAQGSGSEMGNGSKAASEMARIRSAETGAAETSVPSSSTPKPTPRQPSPSDAGGAQKTAASSAQPRTYELLKEGEMVPTNNMSPGTIYIPEVDKNGNPTGRGKVRVDAPTVLW